MIDRSQLAAIIDSHPLTIQREGYTLALEHFLRCSLKSWHSPRFDSEFIMTLEIDCQSFFLSNY
jgi:hypothetical protein